MVSQYELSEFERGMIVYPRWMNISFQKLLGHLRFLDLQCKHVHWEYLMESIATDHGALMIMIRGIWLKLPVVTNKQHWFKLHPHSMHLQQVSSIFFNLYGI